MPSCFKCEKAIECACDLESENDIWMMPCNAVHLQGGSNFGSGIYDSMVDGIEVEVIICDDCLKAAQDTNRLREKNIRKKHVGMQE